MAMKLQQRFSYMSWYLKKGKTFFLTLLLLIDVVLVAANGIFQALLGLGAMAKMGGFIIFLVGVGFVFPLFPILLALIYSRMPIVVEEKLLSKYPKMPVFNRYFIITLAMIGMRIFILFGMYGYSLITSFV